MRSLPRGLKVGKALVLGLVLLCTLSAHANATPIPHGSLELIAENQWIAAGSSLYLGLLFQLEKGWHIYWVNPGDSGEPPRVEWRLPAGISAGPIEWPTPRRFQSSTIVDYGYQDAVLLMVPVTVDADLKPQTSAQIGAAAKLLVCSHEMCIPGKADLSLSLPVRPGAPPLDNRNKEVFAATRKSLPQPAPPNWRLSAAQTSDSFVLRANPGHSAAGRKVTPVLFFPLVASQIDNVRPQKLVSLANGFQITLRKSDQLRNSPARLQGVLIVSSGNSQADQVYSIDVPIQHEAPGGNAAGAAKRNSAAEIRQTTIVSNANWQMQLAIQPVKEEP